MNLELRGRGAAADPQARFPTVAGRSQDLQPDPSWGGRADPQHALGPVYGKMRHEQVVELAPGATWGAWLRIPLGKGGGSRPAPVQGAGRGRSTPAGEVQHLQTWRRRQGKYTESRNFCDSVTRIWPFLKRQ